MLERLNKLKKENKKGFTLIELIVVIAILAILMALAIPAYNGLKRKAAEQVAKADTRSAYTAVKAAQAMNPGMDGTALTTEAGLILGDGKTAGTLNGASITSLTIGTDKNVKFTLTPITVGTYKLQCVFDEGAATEDARYTVTDTK